MEKIYFPEAKAYRKITEINIAQLSELSGVEQKIIILLESGEEIEEAAFVKIAEELNKILKKKKKPLIDIDFIVNIISSDEEDIIFF